MELPKVDVEPTIPAVIRRASELFRDAPLISTPKATLTFHEAEALSRSMARQLVAHGVGKGSRIGLFLPDGVEWMISFLAVTRIGAVCLPLSMAYTPSELRRTIEHGDVAVLVVGGESDDSRDLEVLRSALPSLLGQASRPLFLKEAPHLRSIVTLSPVDEPWTQCLRDLPTLPGPDAVGEELLDLIEAQVTPADWLLVIHTSGTTGTQKGVIHTHGNFLRHAANLSSFRGQNSDTIQFAGLPWFWIGGLIVSVGPALVQGVRLLCMGKFESAAALEFMTTGRPTEIAMWGQLRTRFEEYARSTGRDVSMIPALRNATTPLDTARFHNSLGQTETTGPHSHGGPESGRLLPEELRGSFGLPVPCVEHRVIDPTTGLDVAEGQQGEILIRGYSLAAGLYKLERHETFDDEGWLHTGDRGYFMSGYLFFTGRYTEMIKTSGANVAPREVELALEQAPGVAMAVVTGLRDAERGEIVAAALVPSPEVDLVIAHVEGFVAGHISSYKIPRHYLILPGDDVPLLTNGKVDRAAVAALLEASR